MKMCGMPIVISVDPGLKKSCTLYEDHVGPHRDQGPKDDRCNRTIDCVLPLGHILGCAFGGPEHPLNNTESVNHPSHYGGADNPYEHVKVAEAMGWGYHIGNCTKYIWRLGKKTPDRLLDAEKALWYLNRYVELLKKEGGK